LPYTGRVYKELEVSATIESILIPENVPDFEATTLLKGVSRVEVS
jgi:hypothetical protein